MQYQNIQVVFFSPTGTSKKVAMAVAKGFSAGNVSVIDLTHGLQDIPRFNPSVLTIIAVPVYGGHVAPVARERLLSLRAENAPAILIAVYGNRDYENALSELHGLAETSGFISVAAATFVGEHSYSNSRYPIASGRPDHEDLEIAESLGTSVKQKLEKESISKIDVSKIKRTRMPLLSMLRFIPFVLKVRKGKIELPKIPSVSGELCNHCGLCVRLCPVGAITENDELHTDVSRCIRCCACVKGCVRHAREFNTPFSKMLSRNFSKRKAPRVLV